MEIVSEAVAPDLPHRMRLRNKLMLAIIVGGMLSLPAVIYLSVKEKRAA